MLEIVFLKGLPGSGKSTYAKQLVDGATNRYKRVNKDDLRSMIDNGKHSKGNEALVLKAEEALIRLWLSEGKSVVCDNTHFAPYHEDRIRAIASDYGAVVRVELIDTPLETCIERDSKRPHPVGADVIRRIYNQYMVKPEQRTKYLKQDLSLPRAVSCDIDGSVALINPDNPRSPYDMSRVSEDILHEPVGALLGSIWRDAAHNPGSHFHLVYVSGRNECARHDTIEWLKRFGLWQDYTMYQNIHTHLFMRADGDNRKDYIVKEELFKQHILPCFRILYHLDDRSSVVNHLRGMGLPVFQLAPGDF